MHPVDGDRTKWSVWSLAGSAFLLLAGCGDSESKQRRRDNADGGTAGQAAGSGGSSSGRAGSSGNSTGGASGGGTSGSAGTGAGRAGSSGNSTGGASGTSGANGGSSGDAGGEAGTPGEAGAGGGDGGEPPVLEPLGDCTASGWCWDNPSPGGSNLEALWAHAPDDVWAVGLGGLILRYDGTSWQRYRGPTAGRLDAVWGTGPDDVWIGGADGAFHWNGARWTSYPNPFYSVTDIHGSATNNVRICEGTESVDYFDGLELRSPVLKGFDTITYAIWTFAPGVVYGAGTAGSIMRGDGIFELNASEYSAQILFQAGGGTLRDLWGTTEDAPLWAVGESGLVVTGQGTTYGVVDAGTTRGLRGVWGSSQSDIWAVGDTGAILHFDGGIWTDHSLAIDVALTDIEGTGPNDVWAVGNDGAIVHYDGNTWTTPNTLTSEELWDVSGTSDDDVWAVGDNGTVLHRDENGWSALSFPTTERVGGVWAAAPDDVWIGADDGNLYHYDGDGFEIAYEPVYAISYLWGRAADDVWAAGGGDLHHYDGESWTPFDAPFSGFDDIWASSATDVWFSRGRSGWSRFRDGTWTSGTETVGFLWGTGPDDIWSVHDGPGILHWDGESWTSLGLAAISQPHDMAASASTNLWIVGALGTTDFFDGTTLSHVTTTQTDDLDAGLNGVWVSPTGRAYAVGQSGTIVTHEAGYP
jgi:hypothetical protein